MTIFEVDGGNAQDDRELERKAIRRPPPPTAAVSAPATPAVVHVEATVTPLDGEQAGPTSERVDKSSIEPMVPNPSTPAFESGPNPALGIPVDIASSTPIHDLPLKEPSTKRQKTSVRRLGGDVYEHVDMEDHEHWEGECWDFPAVEDDQRDCDAEVEGDWQRIRAGANPGK